MTENAEKTTNRTEENIQAEDDAMTGDTLTEDNVSETKDNQMINDNIPTNDTALTDDTAPTNDTTPTDDVDQIDGNVLTNDNASTDGSVPSDDGVSTDEDNVETDEDAGDDDAIAETGDEAIAETDGGESGGGEISVSETKRRRNRRRGGRCHRRGKAKGNAKTESNDDKPSLNNFDQAKLWPYHDRMTGIPSLKATVEFQGVREVDLGELGVHVVMGVLMGVPSGGDVPADIILRDLSQANLANNVFRQRDGKGDLLKIIASVNIPQEIRELVNGDTAPVFALTRRGSLVVYKGYREREDSDEAKQLPAPELFFKAKIMENGNLLDGKNRPVLVDDSQKALVAVRRMADDGVICAVRGGCDPRRTHSRGLLTIVRPRIEPIGRGNRRRGFKKVA